ncbi:MAG: helix-turn-helix domain-containing protein [Archaeoglobus sp.]|uniref:helix-turn-helix domain-containing protein n=1 Tax=Archaeoglobus sp. TaxID=1872626 RepID=UPI001D6F563C|nr:helix-turn-helix domain-containing protein [Archaeoglobus sp.]MBO8180278.1 helix-turn-helix domain-containing protein [Archaeoglobus sp.]
MEAEELLQQMPAKVLKAYQIWATNHSPTQTAKIIGVHESTIRRWKKKYYWEEIEKATLNRIVNETKDYIEKIKEDQRKIVKAAILTAVKQLKEGKLKARSLSDLIALLRYQLELEGEFREETNVNVNVNLSIASLHEELMKRRKQALGEGEEERG